MNSRQATEKLLNLSPSEEIGRLIEFKKVHKQLCLKDYRGYVKAFEGCFEITVQAVESLNYVPKSNWPNHRGVQYCFFPGMMETLFKAFDDCLDGFYDESAILHRVVFETIFKIIFVSCYPNDFESVYLKAKSQKRRKFNLTHFLEKDLKIDWLYMWDLGSRATHGKTHRVLSLICDTYRGKKRPVSYNLCYDKEKISSPLNQSLLLSWCSIRLILILFPELLEIKKIPDEFKEKLRTAEKALREILLHMPNKLKETVSDFDYIEKIITTAESGKDWKQVIKTFPSPPQMQGGAINIPS